MDSTNGLPRYQCWKGQGPSVPADSDPVSGRPQQAGSGWAVALWVQMGRLLDIPHQRQSGSRRQQVDDDTRQVSSTFIPASEWEHIRDNQAFLGYFFKTQGSQKSTFFKTQRKYLKTRFFGNEVIITILLHNVEYCLLYLGHFCIFCISETQQNSTIFRNSRYFTWNSRKFQLKTQ